MLVLVVLLAMLVAAVTYQPRDLALGVVIATSAFASSFGSYAWRRPLLREASSNPAPRVHCPLMVARAALLDRTQMPACTSA